MLKKTRNRIAATCAVALGSGALALGGVGLVVSIAGAIIMREAGPTWYPIALVVIALPCAWVGGALYRCGQGER